MARIGAGAPRAVVLVAMLVASTGCGGNSATGAGGSTGSSTATSTSSKSTTGSGPGMAGAACTSDAMCNGGQCGGGYCCVSPCPDLGPAMCSTNGICDAVTGACSAYHSDTVCGTPTCTAGVASTTGVCDSTQQLCVGMATQMCAPYGCGATACNTTCTMDSDCDSAHFCWQSACVALTATAAGLAHSCALNTLGGVQCWGAGTAGQLGNAANTDSPVPVPVSTLLSGVTAVATGPGAGHTCALTNAGTVLCWGDNASGDLGNNAATPSPVPVPVMGISAMVGAIAVGSSHSCALTTGGAVFCWGSNSHGQVGNNASMDSPVAVPVTGLGSGVKAIGAGFNHTCAVMTSGAVQCWGANGSDQLGNATQMDSPVPIAVAGISSAANVTGGEQFSCALTMAGGVQCWGDNTYGQLGVTGVVVSPTPVVVPGISSGATTVVAGQRHTCALAMGGNVQCWGANQQGQLGNNSMMGGPTLVAPMGLGQGVLSVAAGQVHSCAVTSAGRAMCWGQSDNGDLGNSPAASSLVPVAVVEP